MTAEIIKIQKKKSRYGGYYWLVCFKSLSGKSCISYIYERMRNYSRWKKVLNVGNILSSLKTVKGKPNIVDADSRFVLVKGD